MEVAQHGVSWDSDRYDNLEKEARWMKPFCDKSDVPLSRELMLSEEREDKS